MLFKKLPYHIIVNNIFEYGWSEKLPVFYFKHDKFRKLYFSTYSYSLKQYTKYTKYLVDREISEVKHGRFYFKIPPKLIYLDITDINFSRIVNINGLNMVGKISINNPIKFDIMTEMKYFKKNLLCLKNKIYYLSDNLDIDWIDKNITKFINLRFINHNSNYSYKNFRNLRGIHISTGIKLNEFIYFSHLTLLEISINSNIDISDKHLKYIPNLKVLDIPKYMYITDNGLKFVPKLKVLYTTEYMTDEGMKYLKEIQYLDISCSPISNTGIYYVINTLIELRYDNKNEIDYDTKTQLRYKNVLLLGYTNVIYDMDTFI